MGLLIGASCLTILEFFDLIVYNLVLKCMERNKRGRSVTPVQQVEKGHVQPAASAPVFPEKDTSGLPPVETNDGPYYMKRSPPPKY